MMSRIGVLVCWGSVFLGTAAAEAAALPNIVMIVSDDHAWTDYSFMGHPKIQTPRIDRLASQGLTFRRGYVPSSLCSPSLASILTGLYAHQHGWTSNDPPLPRGKSAGSAAKDPVFRAHRREMIARLAKSPTIPKLLAAKGYVSFQTGKWWGGDFRTGGFTEGMTLADPDRGGRHGDAGLKIGRETMTPIHEFIDRATDARKPFFVWYAPMLPHQPHNPPERFLKKYRDQTPSLEVAKYWAMIEWFDETCGQLLDHLDAKGIANDTIVVYLADNGWIQDPDANRYAPRSKQSQYDGGLRTPIIVRWPSMVRPATSDRLASSLDLAPTLLLAAGLTPTPDMPGVSLRDDVALARRKALFGEIFTHNAVDLGEPASSLRYRWAIEQNWKLIVPDPRNSPDSPVELYDLAADPAETSNLASQEPGKVADLKSLVDSWWNPQD
jgi:uncharacterized sulfatase